MAEIKVLETDKGTGYVVTDTDAHRSSFRQPYRPYAYVVLADGSRQSFPSRGDYQQACADVIAFLGSEA
jgi:hypothetical protein